MGQESSGRWDILYILGKSRRQPQRHPLEGLEAPPRRAIIEMAFLRHFEMPILPYLKYITPGQYTNYCEKRLLAFIQQRQQIPKSSSIHYQTIIYDPIAQESGMVIRVGSDRWEKSHAYYIKRPSLPLTLTGITA